jgi:hypothetical protein
MDLVLRISNTLPTGTATVRSMADSGAYTHYLLDMGLVSTADNDTYCHNCRTVVCDPDRDDEWERACVWCHEVFHVPTSA